MQMMIGADTLCSGIYRFFKWSWEWSGEFNETALALSFHCRPRIIPGKSSRCSTRYASNGMQEKIKKYLPDGRKSEASSLRLLLASPRLQQEPLKSAWSDMASN